jgi:flagella basal body P-ring formation protein FlgA
MIRFVLFIAALAIAAPAFANSPSHAARIVVPARDIARGEILSDGDLAYQAPPPNGGFFGVETEMGALRGMEARRMLHAGEPLRSSDVRRPILVEKGAMVTMTFEAPGITLTAAGRAMGEGGMGETVTVQNPVSFRQITTIVTGPGQVRAGLQTATLASGNSIVVAAGQ